MRITFDSWLRSQWDTQEGSAAKPCKLSWLRRDILVFKHFFVCPWNESQVETTFTFTHSLCHFFCLCLWFCFWYWPSWDWFWLPHGQYIIFLWWLWWLKNLAFLCDQSMISVMQSWGCILCSTRDDKGSGLQPFLFTQYCVSLEKRQHFDMQTLWFLCLCCSLCGQSCKTKCKALCGLCVCNWEKDLLSHYMNWRYFLSGMF